MGLLRPASGAVDSDKRLQGKSETLEAALLRILDGLRGEVKDGLLPVRLVTHKLNEGRLEKDKVSDQKVGWRLRSLGFQKGRREETGATIQWDDDRLVRAMAGYGLHETTDSTDSADATTMHVLSPDETVESVELGQSIQGSGARILPAAHDLGLAPDDRAPKPCRPCYACHGTRFWLDAQGAWHCGTCHPPASEDVVAEWLGLAGEGSGAGGGEPCTTR